MGSWTFIRDFIEEVMQEIGTRQQRLNYAGRAAAASPATGSLTRHNREQKALVIEALGPSAIAKKETGAKEK